MDTLSDVLRAVRLTGAFFFNVQTRGQWVAETPLGKSVVGAMFPGTGSDHLICYHAILEGTCWCSLEGEAPIKLEAGDIVLLAHGDTHVLATDVGMRNPPNMEMYRQPEDGRLPSRISVGAETGQAGHFVCGFLACDSRPYNPLLTALPRMLRVSDHGSGALGAYFRCAGRVRGPQGGECMLGRISELMFVDVVRRYIETCPKVERTGCRDCAIPTWARSPLHDQPARLDHRGAGAGGGIVASAFAEKFVEFVGQPPMQYLANWRMSSPNYLRNGTENIASVANRVGYDSEAAFSRAFKKAVGSPPSEWREQHLPGRAA
jgi:hypothetical protein